ncbi:Uncharacterised protein [Streptococcus pneumoniae]|nr:hypothetical protein AC803_03095 [Streptococcus pneumoniae]KNY49888.1 hypothetical protein AKG31_10470 [Streptococcus pneumoniae]CZC97209.1 Uncharacterised protein [Streptococcus pneumoniae]CZD25751.1 Uncharacterised protein [Streptococcus pneumoniae]VIQ52982.1 Uncharacterised protein [Streptococcus pneumoniae]
MIKKYRFCFLGFFVFALLSVYSPTGFGSALSVMFSILAFLFFATFFYYFIRVKLISLSLIIKDIRNKMR